MSEIAALELRGLRKSFGGFVAVNDVAETLKKAEELGGRVIQPEQKVPGTSFGVFADAQGHKVGVAANG